MTQLNADERKALKDMIVEGDKCLTRIDSEREALKDIATAASEKFDLEKKIFNKMVRTYHKHEYDSVVEEMDEFQLLYESVIRE